MTAADGTAQEPGAPGPEKRSGRSRVTVVLAVVAAVATALAAWQGLRAWSAADELAQRAAARDAAQTFAAALFTYDHTDLDAARESVEAVATEDFASTYGAAFDTRLAEVITEVSATSLGQVQRVFVADVVGGTARAVVRVDARVTSDLGTRELTGAYLEFRLVLQDRWRVDEVTPISAVEEGLLPRPDGGQAPGTPTPSEPASP